MCFCREVLSGKDAEDSEKLQKKLEEAQQKLQKANQELKVASRPFDETTAKHNR